MLRWVRGYYLRMLPLTLAVVVVLLIWESQAWVFALLALGALLWIQSVTSLSLRIRREERRERG